MRNLKRWRTTGIVVLVALLLLFLTRATAGPRQTASWVEKGISEALYPLQVVADWVVAGLRGVGTGIGELFQLRRDNAQLRAQVDQIPDLQNRIRELQAENSQLRHQLGLAVDSPQPLLAARVIGRYPETWLQMITLGVGSSDGVQPDMAVRNADGLIGKVLRVTPHTAVVQLIIESSGTREIGAAAGIGAMDQTTRQAGILSGTGEETLRLSFFNCTDCAAVGDPVITSGLGGTIPEGIYIGTIERVGLEQNGLTHVAYVRPAVDFSRLDYVFVVLQPKGGP